ncbi:MAG TPA: TonB family protein [Nitrospirota bacterium]|nr:TonB family protein [Nitrospirota bacterium]
MDNTAARRIKGRGAESGPRKKAEHGGPNMLFLVALSLALHAAVLGIIWKAPHKKPAKTIEIFDISVATLPGPAGGGGKSLEELKPPKEKAAEPRPEEEPVKVARKLAETRPPEPRKKEPQLPEVPEPVWDAPKGPGQGPAGGGKTTGVVQGPIALEGVSNFPYAWYIDTLRRKISGNWSVPGGLARNRPLKVVVYFELDRTGRFLNVAVEKSSGVTVLDQSALRAVFDSKKMPELPAGFPGDSLGVHYTFVPEKQS